MATFALRQFCDLDILVRKQDVSEGEDVLVSQGYRPQLHLSGPRKAAFLKSDCELPFTCHDNKVELHWGITPRYFSFTLDPERLWERCERVSLADTMVLNLPPEDLLLILSVHGSKHLYERLEWVCDVAELLRARPGLDWGLVMKQAKTLGSEWMLCFGLLLASKLLGAVLPSEGLQRVEANPELGSLASRVCEDLFHDAYKQRSVFETSLIHLKMRERVQDRIRYCLRLALTPVVSDWTFFPLPPALFSLYYLLRPLRLLKKYGLVPVGRFLQGWIRECFLLQALL